LLDHGAPPELRAFEQGELAVVPSYQPLWVASHFGHFNIVRLLVSRGASPNTGCLAGFPWAEAFRKGHMEIFNYFLEGKEGGFDSEGGKEEGKEDGEQQQSITWQIQFDAGRNGVTSLHDACRRGNIELVQFLLSKGMQVKQEPGSAEKPHFPLNLASSRGAKLELVKLLVEAGAEVNMANLKGSTPLHRASKMNIIDVAEYLIQQGADVNIDVSPSSQKKRPGTPLCQAATPDMIRLLMHHGAKLAWDGQAAGPLCRAVDSTKLENVKCLISEFNADPNEGIGTSSSPLWAAVRSATTSASLRSVYEKLKSLDPKSDTPLLDLPSTTESKKEEQPMGKELEMIQFLVESGADVNQCDAENNTPLVFIISCFDKSEFAGRDRSWSQKQIEAAAEKMAQRHALLEYLADKFIDFGADVNKPGLSGTTPLQQVLHNAQCFFVLIMSLSLGFKTDEASNHVDVDGRDTANRRTRKRRKGKRRGGRGRRGEESKKGKS